MKHYFKAMARTELIKELSIRRNEIYSELRVQFPELIEELDAIDKILRRNASDQSSNGELKTAESSPIQTEIPMPPKGDRSWEEYVLIILKNLGGKAKSREVAKAIVESNNDITPGRAKDASSDKLSRLLAAGRVSAIKPKLKKEGYTYEIN